ncbi:MAG: hypothetical protein IVW52_09415 [Acidimicrobiales bacterium]|nr:hypothetical protein [Acidimicrobiales bacterium]
MTVLGTESILPAANRADGSTSGEHDDELTSARSGRWGPTTIRLGSHGLVWATVLVPTLIQLSNGWRTVRDDAMISIGSYRVFSAQSPLVGVWSLASAGMRHAFFDLGPLPFWLLAVPTHLDPGQGALWGAALVAGGVLSIGVEAAWSVRGWPAALAVALVVADTGWQTQLFTDVVWNPHFGLVFMIGAGATAWAVASGRFGWWPLAVVFASVAAQSHLIYAIPAVALAVIGPLAGLAYGYRPRRWRWIVVGLVAGAACWVAPLAQEVFGHPGNLSLVLNSGAGHSRVGWAFGLHGLATAVAPRPIWLTQYPYRAAFNGMPHYLNGHPSIWAAVSLCLLTAIAVAAWLAKRRPLSALALIGTVMATATVATLASLPRDNLTVLGYLGNYLWVVGTLIWIIVAWAVGAVAAGGLHRWHRDRRSVGDLVLLRRGFEIAGLSLLALMAFESIQTVVPAAHDRVSAVHLDTPLDSAIVRSVERSVPPGPVVVEVRPAAFGPGYGFYTVDYWGVAWKLLVDGWRPGLQSGFFGVATNLSVPPGARWPKVIVHIDPSTKSVTRVQRIVPAGRGV